YAARRAAHRAATPRRPYAARRAPRHAAATAHPVLLPAAAARAYRAVTPAAVTAHPPVPPIRRAATGLEEADSVREGVLRAVSVPAAAGLRARRAAASVRVLRAVLPEASVPVPPEELHRAPPRALRRAADNGHA